VVTSSQDPNQRDFGTTLVTAPPLDAATYRAAVASRAVLADALRRGRTAPSPTVADRGRRTRQGAHRPLRGQQHVASLFRVLVRDDDPERARDLANAIAAAAVAWDEQRATRALETIVESLEAQIASIDAEIAAAGDVHPIEGLVRTRADLRCSSPPPAPCAAAPSAPRAPRGRRRPREPVSPAPTRNAALAGCSPCSSPTACCCCATRSTPACAASTTSPAARRSPCSPSSRKVEGAPPPAAGGASYLRTAIGFATADADPKVLLVTSTGAGTASRAWRWRWPRASRGSTTASCCSTPTCASRCWAASTASTPSTPHRPRRARRPADRPSPHRALGATSRSTSCPASSPRPTPPSCCRTTRATCCTTGAALRRHRHRQRAGAAGRRRADRGAPHATGVVFAVSVPDADRRRWRRRRAAAARGRAGARHRRHQPPARASRDGGARPVSTAWSSPTPGSVAGLRGSPTATRPGSDQPAHDAVTPDDLIDDSVPAPRVATATRDG
jgi:hypothetical protein